MAVQLTKLRQVRGRLLRAKFGMRGLMDLLHQRRRDRGINARRPAGC